MENLGTRLVLEFMAVLNAFVLTNLFSEQKYIVLLFMLVINPFCAVLWVMTMQQLQSM
jgi:multisubunit Na+/H+ antiporter MnhG subunit